MASDEQQFQLSTRTLHADRLAGVEHGGIHKPIHTSVQFGFERVEDLIGVFQGTLKGGFNYARQGTPTSAALERQITLLEQGVGTIAFSSGMAALTAIFWTLLRAGDHVVTSQFIFGNTNSFFGTLANFDVDVTKVDVTSAANVEAALRPNTRIVFAETIANPATQVPDFDAIGRLCRERGLLFVVDNTITSPQIFRPGTVGAGLVINSLTKTIGGHGAALGGSVTDTGQFDWDRFPNISPSYLSSPARERGLTQIRKKALRDMGAALAPEPAHRISLGLETLPLRVAHTSATADALARFLQRHPAVSQVMYPMLPEHPQYEIAKRHFSAGSWLLSFELRDAATTLPVLNRLRLPIKATGLGDNRTLVIPVAPTIFWEAGPEARAMMGIGDGLVRVSVGLENVDDLIADFDQALAAG